MGRGGVFPRAPGTGFSGIRLRRTPAVERARKAMLSALNIRSSPSRRDSLQTPGFPPKADPPDCLAGNPSKGARRKPAVVPSVNPPHNADF